MPVHANTSTHVEDHPQDVVRIIGAEMVDMATSMGASPETIIIMASPPAASEAECVIVHSGGVLGSGYDDRNASLTHIPML